MKLSKFLVKAKTRTYAEDKAVKKELKDGSKELVYKEGSLVYRDRYFGFDPFSGQETVFKNKKAIWTMNYYGLVTEKVPAKEVYSFLRKAMKQVKENRPFRGPSSFKEGDFKYTDNSKGNINFFSGTEKIFHKGLEVYVLYYHGGLVEDK